MQLERVEFQIRVFYQSRRMMPMLPSAVSKTLEPAFRAALLLTGSVELAEEAVLKGIAGLDFSEDGEKALVAKTAEFVVGHADYSQRLEHSLALLPLELRRLSHLAPVARDCFLLRVLLGLPAASCAAILNLSIERFEETLCNALQQLSALGRSALVAQSNTSHTGAQK